VIGHGHAIEMIGGYALVADGGYGLRVMDLNDPETPAIAATLDIPGWTFDVECIGGLALVLAKEYSQDVEKAIWLHVVDIGDPLNLRPIGAHCLGQSDLYIDRHALAAAEGLLYVLIQGEGVEVYDISQPSGPALVRSLYSSWDVSGLAAGADALTVLNGSQLYLVDVADPAALRTVGNAPVPMWPQQVAQGGAYVYVTGWTSTYEGFPLIPGVSGWLRTAYLGQGNPRPLGMVSFRAHARGVQGVAVADGVVCVTVNDWWQFSLAAYAVGEDGILLERGACELDHAAYYVAVEGARAVVVGDEALTVVDLAGGGPPLPRGTNENLNAPQGVALHKNHAYVADGAGGLCVVSIADLDAPRIVGRCVVGGDAGSVALLGHHAYVGVRGLGVVAVDVADPAEPHVVSLQATPGNANCVTVCGDHVVVGDGPAGLTLYEPVWRAHLPCALSGN